MARGVDGRSIFEDDDDRFLFLSELERAKRDSGVEIMAYCLMGNHFHLAIRVAHVPLSVVMQRLEGVHAQVYNRRHKRMGHLFQARFKAKLCLDELYLRKVIRYIHLNPVRAGLTVEAHHWPWSSLRGARLEDDGMDLSGFDPWENAEDVELDLKRELAPDLPSLADIGAIVAAREIVSEEALKSATFDRRIIATKRAFTQEALKAGHRLVRIAEWLQCPLGSVSRYARAKK
ncbi:MAG: transposase [Elusimicrobiota bacterium]|nr:MAG: transposase [Elusimicrobiota bacterium]